MLPTNCLKAEINGQTYNARRAYRPMSDAVKTKTSPLNISANIAITFELTKGAPAPCHSRQRDFRRKSKQRWHPTRRRSGRHAPRGCRRSRLGVGDLLPQKKRRERLSFLWEQRESNPRPSACKADALNQLSYAPFNFGNANVRLFSETANFI